VDEVGGEVLKQLVFVEAISVALFQAPEYGRTLRALEDYYAHMPPEMGPFCQGIIPLSLGVIYGKLGDHVKALTYAEIAFETYNRSLSYDFKSLAALHLAQARNQCRSLHLPGMPEELQWMNSAYSLLETWVDKDRQAGNTKAEVTKCFLMAEIEGYRAQYHLDKDAAIRATKWLQRGQQIGGTTVTPMWGALTVDLQIRIYIGERRYEEALALALSTIQSQKDMPNNPGIQITFSMMRIATTLHLYVMSHYQDGANRSLNEKKEDVE